MVNVKAPVNPVQKRGLWPPKNGREYPVLDTDDWWKIAARFRIQQSRGRNSRRKHGRRAGKHCLLRHELGGRERYSLLLIGVYLKTLNRIRRGTTYRQIKDVFHSTRVAGHVASSHSGHDNADGGIFRHGYRLERDCYTNISSHCAWTYSGTVSRNCACGNLRRRKCYRS